MSPDELFTRVHRQRADLAAVELALDALMTVLPAELQQKWLSTLESHQATRSAALAQNGADPLAVAQSNAAVDRRLLRLKQSRIAGRAD